MQEKGTTRPARRDRPPGLPLSIVGELNPRSGAGESVKVIRGKLSDQVVGLGE
jgi:hypothetical protein